jgi:hypothetical protein
MEINLLLSEQKHMLGFVLDEGDWPAHERQTSELERDPYDSDQEVGDDQAGNIEDSDGNLSLQEAFAH